MIHWSNELKKIKEQIEQNEQEFEGVAKLGLANTFTAMNTFDGESHFKNKVSFEGRGSNANKKVELSNFDYEGSNFTALKFVNDGANKLQIQTNNTNNQSFISTGGDNTLQISNLKAPTENHHATNKQYVDEHIQYKEVVGGFRFTRQVIEAGKVTKYYASRTYTNMEIPTSASIISCYSKSIPVSGAHLVITFFPIYASGQCLIEIYQYASSDDITTQLNGNRFIFTYKQ